MNLIEEPYAVIKARMLRACEHAPLRTGEPPALIAVSKGQPQARIEAALRLGLRHFGENRVREAIGRWQTHRAAYPDLRLHLIGPLQSNKAAQAVALFDTIHSLDREKIARVISDETARQNRKIACFVQVNTGEEPQKAGIAPADAPDFIAFCRDELSLPVIGLMGIPPADEPPGPHFALLYQLAREQGLTELSMGMSNDFEQAIRFGATCIRVGTALFGQREA